MEAMWITEDRLRVLVDGYHVPLTLIKNGEREFFTTMPDKIPAYLIDKYIEALQLISYFWELIIQHRRSFEAAAASTFVIVETPDWARETPTVKE